MLWQLFHLLLSLQGILKFEEKTSTTNLKFFKTNQKFEVAILPKIYPPTGISRFNVDHCMPKFYIESTYSGVSQCYAGATLSLVKLCIFVSSLLLCLQRRHVLALCVVFPVLCVLWLCFCVLRWRPRSCVVCRRLVPAFLVVLPVPTFNNFYHHRQT